MSGNYKDLNKNGALDGVLAPDSDFAQQGVAISGKPFHSARIKTDAAVHCVELAIAGGLGCLPNDSVDKRLTASLSSYGTEGQVAKP